MSVCCRKPEIVSW